MSWYAYSVLNSQNKCVDICGKISVSGSRSSFANSLNHVCYEYDLNKYSFKNTKCIALLKRLNNCDISNIDESNLVTSGAIRDAILLRDYKSHPYLLSWELQDMIDYLCVN